MHLLLKVVALYKSCDKVMIGGEWGGVCDHGYGVGQCFVAQPLITRISHTQPSLIDSQQN